MYTIDTIYNLLLIVTQSLYTETEVDLLDSYGITYSSSIFIEPPPSFNNGLLNNGGLLSLFGSTVIKYVLYIKINYTDYDYYLNNLQIQPKLIFHDKQNYHL